MGDSFLEKNGVGPRPRICGCPRIYIPVAPERDYEVDVNAKKFLLEGDGVAAAFDVLLHCLSVEVYADRLRRAIMPSDPDTVFAEVGNVLSAVKLMSAWKCFPLQQAVIFSVAVGSSKSRSLNLQAGVSLL